MLRPLGMLLLAVICLPSGSFAQTSPRPRPKARPPAQRPQPAKLAAVQPAAPKPKPVLLTTQGSVVFASDGCWFSAGRSLWETNSGRLLRGSFEYSGSILAIAPDGRRVVAYDSLREHWLKVVDTESGRSLHVLKVPTQKDVEAVALSADGRQLASGGRDNIVRIWDTDSGQVLRTLTGHTQTVISVAISRDGRLLASGSNDGTIKLWDIASGRELATLSGAGDSGSLAFSPDGRMLASGNHDETVKLWDVAAARELRTLAGHAADVKQLAFTQDGRWLASGSGDGTIKVWDPATGRELQSLAAHDSMAGLMFIADGHLLSAGAVDRTGDWSSLRSWEVKTGRETALPSCPPGGSSTVALSGSAASRSGPPGETSRLEQILPTGHRSEWSGGFRTAFSAGGHTMVTSWLGDPQIKVWDLSAQKLVRSLQSEDALVSSLVLSPDGKWLATMGGKPVRLGESPETTARLWDLATGQVVKTWILRDGGSSGMVFSPDASLLALGIGDKVRVLRLPGGEEAFVFLTASTFPHEPKIAFSPDGRWLARGGYGDSNVRVWEMSTGREVLSLPGHGGGVRSLAFSPDGRRLAVGEYGTPAIKLWELPAGRFEREFARTNGPIEALTFSADGNWLLSETLEGEWKNRAPVIKIWEVASGREMRSLSVPGGFLAFTPDARRFASASGAAVALWEAASDDLLRSYAAEVGRVTRVVSQKPATCVRPAITATAPPELVLQTGHSSRIESIAFSPDGCWLATAGDGVRLWELSSGREVRALEGASRFLAFSPDHRRLAALVGNGDSTVVRIWNRISGEVVRELAAGSAADEALRFSPGWRWVAALGEHRPSDGDQPAVRLWEVSTGNEVRLSVLPPTVGALAFSPDERLLAVGTPDKQIVIWDLAAGRALHTLTGHSEFIDYVAFSPDGRWLATSAYDTNIKLWEVSTGREVRSVAVGAPNLRMLAFSPDSRLLAAETRDGVRLWDVATGADVATVGMQGEGGLIFSPDGRWLFAIQFDSARVWEVGSQRPPRSLQRGDRPAISPDARWLASVSDNRVTVQEVASGLELRTLAGYTVFLDAVTFAPDGRWLAAASQDDRTLRLWDASAGQLARRIQDLRINGTFSPDGRWFLSHRKGCGYVPAPDTEVALYDVRSGRKVFARPGDFLAFSPDSQWLAFRSDKSFGHGVQIWNLPKETEGPRLGWHVNSAVFDADGRWLATDDYGTDRIRIWDVVSGALAASGSSERGPALTPDKRWQAVMAPASSGRDLVFAEVATGRELPSRCPSRMRSRDGRWRVAFPPPANVTEHLQIQDVLRRQTAVVLTERFTKLTGPLGGVVFSPNGKRMVSTAFYETKLWDLQTGRPMRTIPGGGESTDHDFCPNGTCLVMPGGRIWDASTGQDLARLVAMRNTADWVVVTPDGLFDGTPDGLQRLVTWRFGNHSAPLETFFNEFYYPGLLAEILAGRRPKAPRDFAQLDRRQPAVTLASAGQPALGPVTSRTVALKLEVAEVPADAARPAGSGARDVRLFRNGSLVKVWRGDVLKGQKQVTLEATVPIVAGVNRFTAYAFNQDNIKSSDSELVVTGAESLRRKGTAYVLAIGINHYANKDYNLNYAVADAQVFGEELARQQTKLGEYAKVEVIPLLDNDATKVNLLAALKRLAGENQAAPVPALTKLQAAQPEDAVFVYYAGHGTASGPRFYLIPHDLGYDGSRTEIDEAGLKTILDHSISDRDLEQAFEKIDAGRLLLVIDACNSGQALEAEEKRRGPMNSKGLAQLAYEKGMYVLTAAQGYQAALEAAQLGHGYLTYALVEEGLKTPSADSSPKDGSVVVREWLDYATLRVPQMQEQGMQDARKLGRNIAMVEGEEKIEDVAQRSLQRPRVFYRREPEAQPLVVAKP